MNRDNALPFKPSDEGVNYPISLLEQDLSEVELDAIEHTKFGFLLVLMLSFTLWAIIWVAFAALIRNLSF